GACADQNRPVPASTQQIGSLVPRSPWHGPRHSGRACPVSQPERHPDSATGGTVMRRLAAPIVLTVSFSFLSAATAVPPPTLTSLTLNPSSISGGCGATPARTADARAAGPPGAQPAGAHAAGARAERH